MDADLIQPVARHLAKTGTTFKALVQAELTTLCDDNVPLPVALTQGADPAGRLRRDGTVSSRIGRPLSGGEDPMPAPKKKPQSKAPKKTPPKKTAAKKPAAKKSAARKAPPTRQSTPVEDED